MRRLNWIAPIVASTLWTCLGAHAHVGVTPSTTAPGSVRLAFTVPHGCAGSPTTAITVQIPEGIIGVKPQPKAGWSLATTRGRYARTYEHYHGRKVAEGVTEVVWRDGTLADDHYDEFVLIGFVTDAFRRGDRIAIPIIQQCLDGANKWVEITSPDAAIEKPKWPAPILRVIEADHAKHHHGPHGTADNGAPSSTAPATAR